jgi:hypothetical protein
VESTELLLSMRLGTVACSARSCQQLPDVTAVGLPRLSGDLRA